MHALSRMTLVCAIACLVFGSGGQAIASGKIAVPKPEQASVCPVCGMFVAKYPEWVAVVVYKDGHAHFFDGAKDLMKYLIEPARYAPGHRKEDIATIAVTDYYNVEPIDAREAYYVIGSDVLGPMGHELVPLASQTEAEEFLKDHSGSTIIRFGAVTPDLLDRLDKGGGQ
jgi:nitrous oxide reductase accessory protein NosL